MFARIRAEYARLLADARIISLLSENLPVRAIDLYDEIERLEESNKTAQKNLIKLVADRFPSVLSDVMQMSEQNFRDWILLIYENPQVFLGQEDKFASLFWSLCNSNRCNEGIYFSEMIRVATSYTMIHWVLTSKNKDVVEPYLAVIQKHANENQLKLFQYKMEVIKNSEKGEGE